VTGHQAITNDDFATATYDTCTACGQAWPCDTRRWADDILARAPQITVETRMKLKALLTPPTVTG